MAMDERRKGGDGYVICNKYVWSKMDISGKGEDYNDVDLLMMMWWEEARWGTVWGRWIQENGEEGIHWWKSSGCRKPKCHYGHLGMCVLYMFNWN
jgi:hypothetical protein